MKVDLSGNNRAELRDAETITYREREGLVLRDIYEQYPLSTNGEKDPHLKVRSEAILERILSFFVVDWSIDIPLPRDDFEATKDLPARDVDRLTRAAMAERDRVFEALNDPDPDPDSPTKPSRD